MTRRDDPLLPIREGFFDKLGNLTRPWVYFFGKLSTRSEVAVDASELAAADAFSTPKNYEARIADIEKRLEAQNDTREYGKEISALKKRLEAITSSKDVSGRISDLEQKVAAELYLSGNADLSAHVSASDPHPGYQLETEKDAASGYAGLDAASRTTKGVDTTDDVVIDLATKGLVLKDTQATPHYWRVTVTTLGALSTDDLGTSKP